MLSLLRSRLIFAPRRNLSNLNPSIPRAPRQLASLVRLSRVSATMEGDAYAFGPYKIDKSEVFYSTPLTYAMVNLRPLLPEMVYATRLRGIYFQGFTSNLESWICKKYLDVILETWRVVKRFVDLTADETSDLWLSAKEVGGRLEHYHEASALTFAIQDGPQAGQTVPHVHIHIIPRKQGDFEKNDEIYDAIDVKEKELKDNLDLDIERKDRSFVEMAREADEYRVLFS